MSAKSLSKIIIIVIFLTTIFFTGSSLAKNHYPTRPITMVVWAGPGFMDTVTRAICKVAEKKLGQTFVVVNKTGAGGVIGVNYVMKKEPDGYTIGVTTTGIHWILPHMRKLPYDPFDIVDICGILNFNFALCVLPDSPFKTYEDILEYARKNPRRFTYGCSGVGTTQHIGMERIAIREGIKWTQVPFMAGSKAVAACLGGHINAVVQGSVDIVPQLQAGKLRMLLSLTDSRWEDAPDAPTVLEKGYDFSALSIISFFGPKGLPEPIRQKLEDVFKESLEDPNFSNLLKKFKVGKNWLTGKEFSKIWKSQYDEMGKVISSIGLAQ